MLRPAFGIEFKNPRQDTGDRERHAWVAQAVGYVHCEWQGYGSLGIFLCPSPLSWTLSRFKEITTRRPRMIAPE